MYHKARKKVSSPITKTPKVLQTFCHYGLSCRWRCLVVVIIGIHWLQRHELSCAKKSWFSGWFTLTVVLESMTGPKVHH